MIYIFQRVTEGFAKKMPENIEPETMDWESIYERERFRVPVRKLSPGLKRYFAWEGWSPEYKIPTAWLANYAKEFHFTDAEILAARTTEEMPSGSGIYFLFDEDECIYVGETKCFRERAEQHERSGMRWTSHSYLEVPKFHTRAIEAYYIRRLRPRFNSDYPRYVVFSELVESLGLDQAS